MAVPCMSVSLTCKWCCAVQVAKANPLPEGVSTVLLSFSAVLPYVAFVGTSWFAVRKVKAARRVVTGSAKVVPLDAEADIAVDGPPVRSTDEATSDVAIDTKQED